MRGVLQVLTLTCSLQKMAAPGKLAIGVFRVMVSRAQFFIIFLFLPVCRSYQRVMINQSFL